MFCLHERRIYNTGESDVHGSVGILFFCAPHVIASLRFHRFMEVMMRSTCTAHGFCSVVYTVDFIPPLLTGFESHMSTHMLMKPTNIPVSVCAVYETRPNPSLYPAFHFTSQSTKLHTVRNNGVPRAALLVACACSPAAMLLARNSP